MGRPLGKGRLADNQHRRASLWRAVSSPSALTCGNIATCFSKIDDERQKKIKFAERVQHVGGLQQFAPDLSHRLRLWQNAKQSRSHQVRPGPAGHNRRWDSERLPRIVPSSHRIGRQLLNAWLRE